jgi:hypothetical protein
VILRTHVERVFDWVIPPPKRVNPTFATPVILLCILASAQAALPEIRLKNDDEASHVTCRQLQRLLRNYDLSQWQFTSTVYIDSAPGVIPHSHPQLTLSTRHVGEDNLLLSTYIHEQLHWYLSVEPEKTNRAIEELRTVFIEVPVGGRSGGPSEYSSYLHLIVNMLEFQALELLLEDEEARVVIEFWARDHYTWIYQTVLDDRTPVEDILIKHGLAATLWSK